MSLRELHFLDFQQKKNQFKAFEIISENYLYTRGERLDFLQEISRNQFVHLHGVTTDVGGLDPLNTKLLEQLKALSSRVQARLHSDHLCFTRLGGSSSFELLPVPRTWKMLSHVSDRLQKIQDFLGHEFLLENISSYFEFDIDEMSEPEFFNELHEMSGAKILLDVNNLYVTSQNFKRSAEKELKKLNPKSIGAYHLGGHEDLGHFLFDTHGSSVAPEVWTLFKKAVQLFGPKPAFLERDENIPADIQVLEAELTRAQKVLEGSDEI